MIDSVAMKKVQNVKGILSEAAHLPNVYIVVKRVHDGSGAHEQTGLEIGVGG